MTTAREVPPRCRGDAGASMVEYSLLVALVAIVCIGALTLLGPRASGIFDGAGDGFSPTTIPDEVDESGGTGGPSDTVPECPDPEPPPATPTTDPDCTTTTTTTAP